MDFQDYHYQRKKKRGKGPLVLLILLLVLGAGVGLAAFLQSRADAPAPASSSQPAAASAEAAAPVSVPAAQNAPAPGDNLGLPEEMRAMWISYIEWQNVDISTEEKMRAVAGEMFDNCKDMGLNTVIVAVRPFADALYESEIFPWSHLLTGTQGEDPGYDPLAVMVELAHERDLRIEAWVNPYRVDGTTFGPKTYAASSPAAQNPAWVREINGAWFDPGIPEVQALITAGIREIAANYDVDGIHIDDYFYPEFTAEQKEDGEDTAFDEETYAQYGVGQQLATWRRQNVNDLVAAAYAAVKEVKPNMPFGISPQGNNENNYTIQYSDVKLWLKEPGYADYIMPQLYWGFGYRTASGRDTYAFGAVSAEWASFTRAPSVRLYAGLAAYRVDEGTDGGAGDQSEWKSGHNLADMVAHLRGEEGFSGFALFRYDSLYNSEEPLVSDEIAALTAQLALGGMPANGGGEGEDASGGAAPDGSEVSSGADAAA